MRASMRPKTASIRSAFDSVQSARVQRARTSCGSVASARTSNTDFSPDEHKQLSATSRINAELSSHTSSPTTQKQGRVSFHNIPSRLNRLGIQKVEKPFKDSEPVAIVSRSLPTDTTVNDKLFITFDLLRTMTPRNCMRCLSATPIFMRTLSLEGKLDPDIISSISTSLTPSELQKFMLNMTQEVNVFTALNACKTVAEVEGKLLELIPMKGATVWIRSDHSNFVVSPTTKEILFLGETILTESFETGTDVITADPANHAGFSVEYDLPLLRGMKSMITLPIVNASNEPIAVLQCCGFDTPLAPVQGEFPPYYISVLKIIRDIIQKNLFTGMTASIPSNVTRLFTDMERSSVPATAVQVAKFVQSAFPCETAEVYEFDEKRRVLIRLNDGERMGEVEGGIAFQAGLSRTPINLANCQMHPSYHRAIDGRYANKSVLAKSLYQGRDHFVVVLRAKPNLPAFMPRDVRLLSELSSAICDALKLAKWLSGRSEERQQTEREMKMLTQAIEAIRSVTVGGIDRWDAVRNSAKQFFDCDTLFVCRFDGRYMNYAPSEIKSKFEDCAAGTAFNYRETIWNTPSDANCKFKDTLYKELGVKCEKSLCFPYRTNGRVAGAIEIVNPRNNEITDDEQKLFGDISAIILTGKGVEVMR